MDTPVNVGLGFPVAEQTTDLLAGISPRVRLIPLGDLIAQESQSPEAASKLDESLRDVEVMFIGRPPRDVLDRAPMLRWVQFIGTGVDSLVDAGLVSSRVTVTKVTGTNALPIAEHCFMFMAMFVKRMALCMENQRRHGYERDATRPDVLEGKTLGVMGLGEIGLETARLGKAYRMRVLAMHRSAGQRPPPEQVDESYPPDRLREMLPLCDFVVDALPLTRDTVRTIGPEELGAMKPTAYLVNVGRGKLIDEPALVRALERGEIAGAGLDVFETEPLPESSPLWDMPNVLITPHVSGDLIDNRIRAGRFFADNLRRYVAGEPLINVVDSELQY